MATRKRGRQVATPTPPPPRAATRSSAIVQEEPVGRSPLIDSLPITETQVAPAEHNASIVKGRRGRRPSIHKPPTDDINSVTAPAVVEEKPKPTHKTTSVTSSAHAPLPSHLVCDYDGDTKYDEHPFKAGHHLVVRYRDGSSRIARIIESALAANGQRRYYIHYLDFNRRMDEWVDIPRIITYPSEANKLAYDYHMASEHSTVDTEVTANTEQIVSTIADLDHDEHEGLDEASLLEHEKITKVKNIRTVQLGRYIMECWYFSPFPKEYYPNGFADCLYFCEFSMRFFRTKNELIRYQSKPNLNRYPPGNEIYRDDNLSFFELDGAVEKIYCQNLCYFAKLFLDHKTLYWDVDQFLFYVLCVQDERGYHPVGYFSKEKYSELGYNLACILTFPCYQRRGFGRVLMEFSFELSKKEEKIGSPEKPLSDLGAIGYRSYWASVLLRVLKAHSGSSISIIDIACMTSILPEDIVSTLTMLGLLKRVCPTGAQRSQSTVEWVLNAPPDLVDSLLQKYPEHKLKLDSSKLHWAPFYVMDPKKDKWSLHTLRAAVPAGVSAGLMIKENERDNRMIVD